MLLINIWNWTLSSILKAGGLFDYEPDVNGNVMIYMRIRMHRKIPELADPMKKFVMHIVNKVDKKTDGQGMAIVFDCSGAGYQNADMDFLTFLINSGSFNLSMVTVPLNS